jgi:hypothetical protein
MTARQLTNDDVRTIEDVTCDALGAIGGTAPLSDIVTKVRRMASAHEWQVWSESAMLARIRKAVTAKDGTGQPRSLSVDGAYKQRTLFTADDYLTVIKHRLGQGREMINAARRLADECEQVHGVTFDVDALLEEAASAVR